MKRSVGRPKPDLIKKWEKILENEGMGLGRGKEHCRLEYQDYRGDNNGLSRHFEFFNLFSNYLETFNWHPPGIRNIGEFHGRVMKYMLKRMIDGKSMRDSYNDALGHFRLDSLNGNFLKEEVTYYKKVQVVKQFYKHYYASFSNYMNYVKFSYELEPMHYLLYWVITKMPYEHLYLYLTSKNLRKLLKRCVR